MEILYGIENHYVNVTSICLSKLNYNDIITIPAGDINRSNYFTDHLYGIHKNVRIIHDNQFTTYDAYCTIKIDLVNNTITTITNNDDIDNKVTALQSKLDMKYGTFMEELPEQKMAVRYLTGKENVLEIGGNIGRNSLIIASLLESTKQLVTMECDENIASQLTENRDLNHFQFHIECAALSKRQLIQKGWDTLPSDILLDGYKKVNTITLDELRAKYNITFDTLVLDCEGAFYYILIDMPEILDNINLIIMENDYWDASHKEYVNKILSENGFHVDYREAGGWGPCYDCFFEVWTKKCLS
jgi:FkbM family methyltransferase